MEFAYKLASLGVFTATLGAFFGLGLCVVCKLLKWSPVNITVHQTIYKPEDE